MDPYEKIIKTIRKESNRGMSNPIMIGQMISAKTLKIKGMNGELDEDDLYFLDGVIVRNGDNVLVARVTKDKFCVIGKVVG